MALFFCGRSPPKLGRMSFVMPSAPLALGFYPGVAVRVNDEIPALLNRLDRFRKLHHPPTRVPASTPG